MKSKRIIFNALLLLAAQNLVGQHSGNNIIGPYSSYNQADKTQTVNKLYLSDSAFIIQANILLNVIADSYVATFGVNESSKTLSEANTKIDKRIEGFILALTKIGISQADIYVDLITQTQMSDYKINGNYAEQYMCGFEQKKNVIIKFKSDKDLDKIILAASDQGIYDLAKVDYVVTDISKIYSQLFQTATDVINAKKELYVKATNIKLTTTSQIYGESFYSSYPSQLYKSYTPDITTEYIDLSAYGKRKDLRKNTTYYYDKTNYSGFDKIVNPIVTQPTVEFVLALQIKFNIEKNKK